uniref:DDE-1 domain-containing protein n=1 Tax=Amphimedon queenslandica TaxID=400682 RepID=A0A1X7U2T1_AMPQE
CVSAPGFCLPPFVIIDQKRFNAAFAEGEVPGTAYGLSHNGWMDQELFHLWFKDHFLKYIIYILPDLLFCLWMATDPITIRKLFDLLQRMK